MYIDSKFNSLLTVLQNLFHNFSTTAIKLHQYIRAMEVRPSEKIIQGNEFMDEINGRRHRTGHRIAVHINQVPSEGLERQCMLRYRDACSMVCPSAVSALTFRLGAKAFFVVLTPKQTGYYETLKWLREMMTRNHCGRLQRNVERIAARYNITRRVKY
jgi:hypothetical protein